LKNQSIGRLRQFSSSRRALSTVVTTLIILIVSTLLAGAVTYYVINVTSTQLQGEGLSLTMLHVWVVPTGGTGAGTAEAAFEMINTGGRDLSINKITIRGQSVGWNDVFTAVGSVTDDDLAYSSELTTNDAYAFTNSGDTLTQGYALTQAQTEITPKSGNTLIVYINNPDNITVNDIGLTVEVTVFTSQATYTQKCNVEVIAPSTTTSTNDIQTRDSTLTDVSTTRPPPPSLSTTSLAYINDGRWHCDDTWATAPAENVYYDTTTEYQGNPSWRIAPTGSGAESAVDNDWASLAVTPGETVTMSVWIYTTGTSVGTSAGATFGIDFYTANYDGSWARIDGVNAPQEIPAPIYGDPTNNGWTGAAAFNVPWGSSWVQRTYNFVVPSQLEGDGIMRNNQVPSGTFVTPQYICPWLMISGSTQYTTYFSDFQLYINP